MLSVQADAAKGSTALSGMLCSRTGAHPKLLHGMQADHVALCVNHKGDETVLPD